MDCSRTSSRRRPSRRDTASFASRILPSRSQTKTGSGAFAMMRSAASVALAVRSAGGERASAIPCPFCRHCAAEPHPPTGARHPPGGDGAGTIVRIGRLAVYQVITVKGHRGIAGAASERQVLLADRGVVAELARGALVADVPLLEHVDAVREVEREVHVLLGE